MNATPRNASKAPLERTFPGDNVGVSTKRGRNRGQSQEVFRHADVIAYEMEECVASSG